AALACPALAHDQDCRGTVVDAGRVARRDRAALAEGGPQGDQLLQRRVGTRVLVAIDDRALATLAAGNLDRHDLLGEDALLLSTGGTALALQREQVLILARDAITFRHVLGRLTHAVGVVQGVEPGVVETPRSEEHTSE